jgi:helix-turn-helix protein
MNAEAAAGGGSGTARRMWQALETLHMTVYFAPEPRDAYRRAGLRGGWMGYFASRSAAMGPVPAEVVMATFYNFHPRMVRRAIPDAWGFAPPAEVLAARFAGADAALRRLLGRWVDGPEVAEAAALGRQAMDGLEPSGRPLFAAHAALPWPEVPHLALWHAATLYREFRGDGHVACLTVEGIDGCEAHVLAAGAGQLPGSYLREFRGWSEEEWAAAVGRLRDRGWVEADGSLTEAGRVARERREGRTDDLSMPPWRRLGEGGCVRLLELLDRPVRLVVQGGGVPFPNPVGLPAPAA